MASRIVTSGLIAAAIGVGVTVGLSFVMPPPWELSRALVCVAIAGFMGAAIGFSTGHASGKRGE